MEKNSKAIPKLHVFLFQLGFIAFFSLPIALLCFITSIIELQAKQSVCLGVWLLSWAAYYRHGFEHWDFKEIRSRFDEAFGPDDGYNGHTDENELKNLIYRIEEASKNGYFETVADIRKLIPKIANRGNISKKFRQDLKSRFPYLSIH